jgi:hypothetical protein
MAGEMRLQVSGGDPHGFGRPRREDQGVAALHFEKDERSFLGQFDDCRELLKPPPGDSPPRHGLAAHSDLLERRLNLVERKRARGRKREPRAQQDRGRRSV